MSVKVATILVIVSLLILNFSCRNQAVKTKNMGENKDKNNTLTSGNPIIRHKFTADPAVLVYNETVYLYTGHDEAPIGTETYLMKDWLCFSSKDLVNWTEYPTPLKSNDFSWSKGDAYASKVIERDGKFFWYAPVTHATIKGKGIGVAVADNPT